MSCPGTWAGGFAEAEPGATGESASRCRPGWGPHIRARRCDQS
jgi:hypothetical protein